MNRTVLAILAAAVVAVAAIGYFLAFNDDEQNSSAQPEVSAPDGQSPAFEVQGLDNLAFEAQITGSQDGDDYELTMQYDGDGNFRMAGEQDGEAFANIFTAEAYYSCSQGDCIRFPINQSGDSAFQPDEYSYSSERIGQLASGATYLGQRDCPAGTCEAWQVSENGTTSTLYLDSRNRISQAVLNTAEGEVKVVYTYKDINIEIPQNAQTIPTLEP